MKKLILTTAVTLALASAAHAQILGTTNTGTGIKVGNDASTVRVDGNSTIRTFNDGTTTITRPTNDAVDNTRLGTEVRSSTTANPRDARANVDANANADINPAAGTRSVYDPATGITRSVTGTASGTMGSVVDTIKGPLDSGASVGTSTSGSVSN